MEWGGEMDFQGIEPFVRHIEKIREISEVGTSLISYDHILLYVTGGEAELTVNAVSYTVRENSLLFIQSGTCYRITGWKKADGILMHFDFGSDHRMDYPTYLKPVEITGYEEQKNVEQKRGSDFGLGDVVFLEDVYELEHFFQYILLEEKQQEKYFDIIGSAFVRIILAYAGRHLDGRHQESKLAKHDVVDDIVDFLSRNLDQEISNELIGKRFGFHPKYVNALFERETGYSIHKYVRVKRIARAIEYLQTTEWSVCEIAEKLGFSDVKYFSKVFKKMVDKTPQEYRKMVLSARE